MHRVPMLQWKTWVRLAFVPAGKDWRALNDLAVEGGVLRDYGIMPERDLHGHSLGVCGWGDPAPTITSARSPAQGRFAVADPRPEDAGWQADVLGVRDWWIIPAPSPAGRARRTAQRADPRTNEMPGGLGVLPYAETAGTIAGESLPTNGAYRGRRPRASTAIQNSVQLGVRLGGPAACVKGVTGQSASAPDPMRSPIRASMAGRASTTSSGSCRSTRPRRRWPGLEARPAASPWPIRGRAEASAARASIG
jgi:hypothetical protein